MLSLAILNIKYISQVDVCVDFPAFFALSVFNYLLGFIGIWK